MAYGDEPPATCPQCTETSAGAFTRQGDIRLKLRALISLRVKILENPQSRR
jgi:hypothetical protein